MMSFGECSEACLVCSSTVYVGGSAEALVTLYSHFYFSVTILVTIVTRNLDFFCDGKLRQLPPPGVRLIHERFLK